MIELKDTSNSTLEYPTKMNFVEVAFARSRREAMLFRGALSDASIASDIEAGGSRKHGFAVLVESSMLVDASEALASLAQSNSSRVRFDADDDDFDDDDFSDDDDDFDDDDGDDDDDFFSDDDDDDDEEDDDYENDDDE
ncbi:MAG: hypothetical protein H6818_04640 [Phycisphaerales bacterium]|nr:hypothetical protein [Phycisphaerales bacterium]